MDLHRKKTKKKSKFHKVKMQIFVQKNKSSTPLPARLHLPPRSYFLHIEILESDVFGHYTVKYIDKKITPEITPIFRQLIFRYIGIFIGLVYS